jgi:hypothetical protein
MFKLAAVLTMVTALGNVAPPPSNPNLDAAPLPANAQPYVAQPGPPVDAQFQHGAVDPRGTDEQPLVVRVAAMPPVSPTKEMAPPAPPPSDSGFIWIAVAFGVLQSLLLIALVYFVMQMANGTRRMAEAVERSLGRKGDAP